MPAPPDHADIFERAVDVGEERLDQSTLELASTGVIAGYTIVFGIAALGIVHAAVATQFGDVARVAGALAFGSGFAFLVVGRSELFAENVFDPTAAVVDRPAWELVPELARLWSVTLVCNLFGGALVVLVFSVEGVLPAGTDEALATTAAELIHRPPLARFASAVVGGALVALLSYFDVVLEHSGSRITISYLVGVLLTLGPFDHVVVTTMHAAFALAVAGTGDLATLLDLTVVGIAGNVVGGVGLVTTTHASQAVGAGADGSDGERADDGGADGATETGDEEHGDESGEGGGGEGGSGEGENGEGGNGE